VCRYGAPKFLVSDRGSNFISSLAEKVYELLKIKKVTTTSYHPQSNGIVERFNGVLVDMLAKYASEKDWDSYVPYVLSAYRSTYNSSIGETPYYMLFGRQMILPVDSLLDAGAAYWTDRSDYCDEIAYRLHEAHERAKQRLRGIADSREEQNAEIKNPKEFKVGEQVLVLSVPSKKENPKLRSNVWKGPFQVLERISLVNYRLDIPPSTRGQAMHDVIHVSRLKKYYNPNGTAAAVAAGE